MNADIKGALEQIDRSWSAFVKDALSGKNMTIIEEPEIDDEDDAHFEPCENCDLPDACADFGCAIKSGLRKPSMP